MDINNPASNTSGLSSTKSINSTSSSEALTPGTTRSSTTESQKNVLNVAKRALEIIANPVEDLLAKTTALRNQVHLALSKSDENLKASKEKIKRLQAQKSNSKKNSRYETFAKSISASDSLAPAVDSLAKAKAEYKLLMQEHRSLEAKDKGLSKTETKITKQLASEKTLKTSGVIKRFFSSTGLKTKEEIALREQADRLERKLDQTFRQVITSYADLRPLKTDGSDRKS